MHQIMNMAVAREPMMIEFLQPVSANTEASREATNAIIGLQHYYVSLMPRQLERRRKTCVSRTNDDDRMINVAGQNSPLAEIDFIKTPLRKPIGDATRHIRPDSVIGTHINA